MQVQNELGADSSWRSTIVRHGAQAEKAQAEEPDQAAAGGQPILRPVMPCSRRLPARVRLANEDAPVLHGASRLHAGGDSAFGSCRAARSRGGPGAPARHAARLPGYALARGGGESANGSNRWFAHGGVLPADRLGTSWGGL